MIRIISADDYVTSVWSGGTTTQLAIAPADAVYADRTFLWRVSSATVDLEESEFTSLPDYIRLISTLEGTIALSHNGGAWFPLRPTEVHRFDGADQTRSRGRCRDFNLMLRKGAADGEMEYLRLCDEQRTLIARGTTASGKTAQVALVYCAEGCLTVLHGGESAVLRAGETALCDGAEDLTLAAAKLPAGAMYCVIRTVSF